MSVSRTRMMPNSEREAIRELFLQRRHEYGMNEAARLLCLTMSDAVAWAKDGRLHLERRLARKQVGGFRKELVEWKDLASAALLRWTVMQIHDALATDANGVLPPLLRPVEMKGVQLPAYQVRLLELLADRARVTPDEFLYEALLSLEVSCSIEEIERMLPGFVEAITFPDEE